MHGADAGPSSTADAPQRRSRSGGSRRALPSGRALVGATLIATAAVVVFAAYAGAQARPTTTVVVARHDLDPGDRLTTDALEVRAAEITPELASRSFSDTDGLIGAVALGPVGAGELVQEASVRAGTSGSPDLDPGMGPEFSFPVDAERALAGDVRPGEEVDLLATTGTGSDASTMLLAHRARVLHVHEARTGTLGSSGRLVLTVALASGDEVVAVAHASQVAAITVVRPTGAPTSTTTATGVPSPGAPR